MKWTFKFCTFFSANQQIVPVELSLCQGKLISDKYFTLEELNTAIQSFPYSFSDNTNRPQRLPQTFKVNGTMLLPLVVSHLVPEKNMTWRKLLELKDIVELYASSVFTTESLCY